MGSTFDSFYYSDGFDCRKRNNAFDVYGTPAQGWVVDWSGSGGSFPIEIHGKSGGSEVYSVTPPGSGIGYIRSGGGWSRLYSGLTADSLEDAPILVSFGSVIFLSYDSGGAGGQGRLSVISSTGAIVTPGAQSTQLQGFSLARQDESPTDVYWHQWYSPVGSGTGGKYSLGIITWDHIIGNRGRFFSERSLNNVIFNSTGIWSGTTGGILTNTGIADGGSGWPLSVREPCVYSGVAYCAGRLSGSSYAYFWKMNSPGSGWQRLGTGFDTDSDSLGNTWSSTALGGSVYTCSISGTFSGTTGLYIWRHNIASGVTYLDAAMDISAWSYTAETAQGNKSYFTHNGSSIFLATYGYVFRKDI